MGRLVRWLVSIEGLVLLSTHEGFSPDGVAETQAQSLLLFLVTDLVQCLLGEVMTRDDYTYKIISYFS